MLMYERNDLFLHLRVCVLSNFRLTKLVANEVYCSKTIDVYNIALYKIYLYIIIDFFT